MVGKTKVKPGPIGQVPIEKSHKAQKKKNKTTTQKEKKKNRELGLARKEAGVENFSPGNGKVGYISSDGSNREENTISRKMKGKMSLLGLATR